MEPVAWMKGGSVTFDPYRASCWRTNGDAVMSLFAFDDRMIVGDAFRIADEAMMDMLMCHSLPDEAICSGFGGVLALTDEDGDVVRTLAEADAPVQEALDWLRRRKLAELVTAEDGAECIYLPPYAEITGRPLADCPR